ncbi:Uncharacterised protein [Mycobacteroides abscessus subsp. abscessus]|nr:Uncharacterised protein [Mycobacteroides abscessus subsp. abscessus]
MVKMGARCSQPGAMVSVKPVNRVQGMLEISNTLRGRGAPCGKSVEALRYSFSSSAASV